MGDTEISTFDYNGVDRLSIGGSSQSQDMVGHTGSVFVTFEDSNDYHMMWAKEFYKTSYSGQMLQIREINIVSAMFIVFVGISNPLIIMKLSTIDGSMQ